LIVRKSALILRNLLFRP